jgi:tetratricopeptide (TPR) repeat protein
MRSVRWLVLFAISMLFAVVALAQRETDPALPGTSVEITGQLRAPDPRLPISNLIVRLDSSGNLVDQTSTDPNGHFRFSRLRRGAYTVTVRAPGYQTAQQAIDLFATNRAHILLDLVPEKTETRAPAASTVDARVPAEAQKEYDRGQSDLRDHKTDRAIVHLERAAALHPDFFDAHLLLGTVYREAAQWEKAERSLRRALELRPETVTALIELGEVYRRQKRYHDAERALAEALRLDAGAWQAHFTLARVYWEKGEVLKAAAPTGRALQLRPDYAEAHLLGGNIFVRLGRFPEAVVEYEEYLRLAPKGEFAEQARELTQKLKRALAAAKPSP